MSGIAREINKTEIVKSRSERNKVFSLGPRRRLLECHCKPIHYQDGLSAWEEIRCDLLESSGNLEADRNRVKTSIRHDKYAGNVLAFEDRQNRLIRFTPLRVDVNGLKLTDLGPTKQFRSISQKSPHEVLDVVNDDLSIEHYINEMGGKVWFVLPQMPKSFNITIQVDLSGDLVCLNQLGKDGFYIKDKYGRFNFGSPLEAKPVFWINPPFWTAGDNHFHSIAHSLANVGGTLIYSKFSTVEFQVDSEKVIGPIYIDVNTYYSESSDGWVQYYRGEYTFVYWDTAHDATDGQYVDSDDICYYYSMRVMEGINGRFSITRSFFYFDTSDLTSAAEISATSLLLYPYTSGTQSAVSAQQGTQADTLTTADYDAFSGDEFGHVSWSSGWKTISFNAAGIAAVSKAGNTYICCRNYTYDYLDNEDFYVYGGNNGCYYSNYTGTDVDPKLNVTYSEGSPPNINQPLWFS